MSSYDQWKLASPYDFDEPELCDHEEYDVDWEGLATCDSCHHSWRLTPSELAAHDRRQRQIDRDYAREMRRERIRLLWDRLTSWLPWKQRRVDEDEILF
jgi:hypothetical protein